MSTAVIEYLDKSITRLNQATLYLYLDHNETDEQRFSDLMRDLLKQLIQLMHSKHNQRFSAESYNRLKAMRDEPSTMMLKPDDESVQEMLINELKRFDRTYVIVDALDECIDGALLRQKLQCLKEHNVKFWFTQCSKGDEGPRRTAYCNKCKKEPLGAYWRCVICTGVDDEGYDIYPECRERRVSCEDASHELEWFDFARLEINANEEDIRRYVTWRLQKEVEIGSSPYDERLGSGVISTSLGDRCRDDEPLTEKIKDVISTKAEGNFLLASLYLQLIQDPLSSVLEVLESPLPQTHEEAYEAIMNRIESDYNAVRRSLVKKLLTLIVCTRRPLSWAEMNQAIDIEMGHRTFRPGRRNQKSHVLRLALGLVTIEPSSGATDSGAVRIIHKTAQRYFEKTRDKWFDSWRADIASITLTYLNFPTFTKPCVGDSFMQRKQENPFLAYAGAYWGVHAREEGCSPEIEKLVLQIVDNPERLQAIVQALYHLEPQKFQGWDNPKNVSPVHMLAWFGLDNAIGRLREQQSPMRFMRPLNSTDDEHQRTPLMYACRQGFAVQWKSSLPLELIRIFLTSSRMLLCFMLCYLSSRRACMYSNLFCERSRSTSVFLIQVARIEQH